MGKGKVVSRSFHGKPNIVLVGPMGVGKTTIGRQLAKSLRLKFKDSDREIEKRTGVDIPLIFELEGEEGFRRREAGMIEELSVQRGLVIATGGGAVINPLNRDVLSQNAAVIYLSADIEQLLERTSKDAKRPLLQTENPEQRIRELLMQRDPLYREVANIVVNTGGRSVKAVIKEIVEWLESPR